MIKKSTLFVDKSITNFLKANPGNLQELDRVELGIKVHAAVIRFAFTEALEGGASWWDDLPVVSVGEDTDLAILRETTVEADRLESVLRVNPKNSFMWLSICFYNKGKGKPIRRFGCNLDYGKVTALKISYGDEVIYGIA